jgi:V8-like Glu-specific endopeptidase
MTRLPTNLKLILASAVLFAACADTGTDAEAPSKDDDLHGWLVGEAVPSDRSIIVDASAMPTDDPDDPRFAVGVTAPVDARIEFTSVSAEALSSNPIALTHGAIRGNGHGFVWSASLVADGAAALRVNITNAFLPRNAELYLYNESGDVAGPYSRRDLNGGELWTQMLRGDRLTVQLHYQGTDVAGVLAATRFDVFDVGVLDDRFMLARYSAQGALERGGYCDTAECVENAECGSIPAAVADAQDAVALIVFTSGAWQYICSGGLIADTDSGSNIPYFLTANHCISKGGEASSVEAYFNFTTSCGSSSCSLSGAGTSVVNGSTIIASNRTSDYTLLRLSGAAPAGAAFLDFDNSAVAFADGTALYRISHPTGAPQGYSKHEVDTSYGTCSSWPRGSWIYSRDVYGGTQGGSSGSPVVNAAGKVVGQLSGGCGTNISDDCDSDSNATVDGALAAYWDSVAPYLDPGTGGGCTDADGDGHCAEDGDCNDADASVHPGAAEDCGDGVDNDCDGATDSADSDCGTGSCDRAPKGASCDADSQCCSSKCKGKPGGKTCK